MYHERAWHDTPRRGGNCRADQHELCKKSFEFLFYSLIDLVHATKCVRQYCVPRSSADSHIQIPEPIPVSGESSIARYLWAKPAGLRPARKAAVVKVMSDKKQSVGG